MKGEPADVCLIVEGTYPYVRGGVSSWLHELICALPQISFSLLHVGAQRRGVHERQYELPANVTRFAEVFVHETVIDGPSLSPRRRARARAWGQVAAFHNAIGLDKLRHGKNVLQALAPTGPGRALTVHDALFSLESWDLVRELYGERAPTSSFIDYFWTWRAVHAPILQTLIAEIPPARVYHAICTGYAGLLGVIAKQRTSRPLILTEHGIYVRERLMDLARATWLYEEPVRVRLAEPGTNPVKEMWRKAFTTLGALTYDACDEIITLFEGNRQVQHELGADAARTRVIPNGIRVEQYESVRKARHSAGPRPLRVGFVGRVVPIKDVRTLIRAAALVQRELPNVEFWVVGPTDEDPDYFRDCQELVQHLQLRGLQFLGLRDAKEIYPHLDALVLTSFSEGQPLVLLEAACAGLPAVATDVGACRELLEGGGSEDRALGPGGIVTSVAAADETAAALVRLLGDTHLHQRMAAAGMARAARYYKQEAVVDSYRALYRKYCCAAGPVVAAAASETVAGTATEA